MWRKARDINLARRRPHRGVRGLIRPFPKRSQEDGKISKDSHQITSFKASWIPLGPRRHTLPFRGAPKITSPCPSGSSGGSGTRVLLSYFPRVFCTTCRALRLSFESAPPSLILVLKFLLEYRSSILFTFSQCLYIYEDSNFSTGTYKVLK